MNTIIYFHAVPTKAFKHGVHTCHHREKGMVCTIIRGKVGSPVNFCVYPYIIDSL